jgi:hypothetical protein
LENWTLEKIAPRFLVYDKAETLSFYEKLGFKPSYDDGEFIILSRDNIDLHLNMDDSPVTNRLVFWIGMKGIEALYEVCLANDLVRYQLETKSYGMKEFGVCDPSGNLILFAEEIV